MVDKRKPKAIVESDSSLELSSDDEDEEVKSGYGEISESESLSISDEENEERTSEIDMEDEESESEDEEIEIKPQKPAAKVVIKKARFAVAESSEEENVQSKRGGRGKRIRSSSEEEEEEQEVIKDTKGRSRRRGGDNSFFIDLDTSKKSINFCNNCQSIKRPKKLNPKTPAKRRHQSPTKSSKPRCFAKMLNKKGIENGHSQQTANKAKRQKKQKQYRLARQRKAIPTKQHNPLYPKHKILCANSTARAIHQQPI